MAALRSEVKAFIVHALACFDTPSQVVEAVKKEFGVDVSRQTCEGHDPTKYAGRGRFDSDLDLHHSEAPQMKICGVFLCALKNLIVSASALHWAGLNGYQSAGSIQSLY